MADSDKEAEYKQQFIRRVREARVGATLKQWQVAQGMDIAQDYYKHYEVSRLMPHHLMGKFCLVTRVNLEWLVTGKGPKSWQPLEIVESETARKPQAAKRKIAKSA